MRLEIKGLNEWRAKLDQARIVETMANALVEEAERLAQAVREGLAEPQGAGDHDRPWKRTGALQNSIEAQAEGLQASVGSNDPAAAPQEMGTARIPPRPFLAPIAAAEGEAFARTIGQAVATAFKGGA